MGNDSLGRKWELIELRANGQMKAFSTQNANAAISTNADQVRNSFPFNVDGTNWNAGVWDGGSILNTHQEFDTRVVLGDVVASHYHATHVGGTIGASGVVANAQGMAPNVTLVSYDWGADTSEMLGEGATSANQPDKVYVSNHSYGFITGWANGTWSGNSGPHWWGSWNGGANLEADGFGQYSSSSRSIDSTLYSAPYMLPFRSAGNDRNDSEPANGSTFYYLDGGWQAGVYDNSTHPLGDGDAEGGYDSITESAIAKNLVTVGAANDAVSGGVRNPALATPASFSGWGPADDGRIKPDIVANGVGLYSTDDDNNADYRSLSGTSMSSPNAAGSAILLQDFYNQSFGQAMRASTLKALIIHTADDIGNAGPDYQNGWGLMDTLAAANLIKQQADAPESVFITENTLTNGNTNDFSFTWDGVSTIKASIAWTDPPGSSQSALDSRTPALVNDLDLRIMSPGGAPVTFLPFVLDVNNPANLATNGDNIVDNVEQVLVPGDGEVGEYSIQISHKNTLTNGVQDYALIISGIDPEDSCMGSLDLNNTTINDSQDYEVCGSVTIGPNVTVGATGTLEITARDSITISPDFNAVTGSSVNLDINPAL